MPYVGDTFLSQVEKISAQVKSYDSDKWLKLHFLDADGEAVSMSVHSMPPEMIAAYAAAINGVTARFERIEPQGAERFPINAAAE